MEHYGGARIRRAWIGFFLGRGVQAVAGITALLWLVRLLPVADFAVYGILLGLIELAAPLASLGLAAATQQFLPQAVVAGGLRTTVAQVLRWRTVAILVAALLIALAWPSLGAFAGVDPARVSALLVFLLVCIGLLAKVAPECLEAMLLHEYANTARALLPIVRLLSLAALVWAFGTQAPDVVPILMVEIVAAACSLLLGLAFLWKALRNARPAEAAELEDRRRRIVAYARDMFVVEWSNATVNPGALRLVAGYAGGADTAALYAFVQGLQMMLARYLPVIFLLPVVRPILVDRFVNRGETQVLQQIGNLLWKGNLLVLVPALVVCLVAGDALVSLASGGKFSQGGMMAVLVICILVPQSSRRVLEMVFQVTDRTRLLRHLAFISPVILAVALVAARLGVEAMLLAVAAGSVVWNLAALFIARGHAVPFRFERRAGVFFLLAVLAGAATGFMLLRFLPPVVAALAALLPMALTLLPARVLDRQAIRLLRGRGKPGESAQPGVTDASSQPEPPFFIVGAPRSGTTLMEQLLNRHPAIFVPPETFFFSEACEHGLKADESDPAVSRAFAKAYVSSRAATLIGLADQDADDLLADGPAPARMFMRLLARLRPGDAATCIGEKTPAHIYHWRYIHRVYPSARFIVMLRDGRAVTRSRMNHPNWESNWVSFAVKWRREVRAMEQLQSTLGPDRCLVIRYEDLLCHVESELRRACEFLGQPWEPAMLEPENAQDAARRERFAAYYGLDWMKRSSEKIEPARAEAWRREYSPAELGMIEWLLGDVLKKHGYAVTARRGPAALWLLLRECVAFVPIVWRRRFRRKAPQHGMPGR